LKCFVINSVAIVDDGLIDAYGFDSDNRAFLEQARLRGGACIMGPRGQILAGPMPAGEGILYADVNPDDVIVPKFFHDFAGHYNRPELFSSLFKLDPAAPAAEPQRVTQQTSSEHLGDKERPNLVCDPTTLLPQRDGL
jgi:nitrilase